MNSVLQDLRIGIRLLKHSPGFALTVILIMGLGIGASATIFSFVSNLMIRPLAIPDVGNLIQVFERVPGDSRNQRASFRNFLDWQEQNEVFESMAAFRFESPGFADTGDPERIQALRATHSIFSALRVPIHAGRAFTADEDSPGATPVAVLTQRFWRTRFGGDAGAIGRSIRLDGVSFTIIGVLATDPEYFGQGAVWIPLAGNPSGPRSNHFLSVVGRLKEGIGLERARADMANIARRLTDNQIDNRQLTVFVSPLQDSLLETIRPALLMVMAASILLLLIACANIANLVLARSVGRTREIAIRSALGAGRWRIIRQLGTESLLLSSLGGIVGLVVAYQAIGPLVALTPENNRLVDVGIDARVLTFIIGISVMSGVFFGLGPALKVTAPSRFGRRHFARNALVISEVAIALVLVAGTGLLIKSYREVLRSDSGLNPNNVLTMRLSLPLAKYPREIDILRFYGQALEEVRSLPGVESAATALQLPFGPSQLAPFALEEGPEASQTDRTRLANSQSVSGEYFDTMGVRLRAGRRFTDQDTQGSEPVAIINDTLSRRYWPGEDPVGRRIRLGPPEWRLPWMSIVGVVSDVRTWGLDQDVPFEIYTPFLQNPNRSAALVLRTSQDPLALAASVRSRLYGMDADQPVVALRSMRSIIDESLWQRRVTLSLMLVFGVVALALCSTGLYSVIAYSVHQRQNEIGIRLALGANRRDILRLALAEGMKLTAIGVVVGLVAAAALMRFMAGLLFRVRPADPATLLEISLLLLTIAFLAIYLPARRAMKVDPVIALRVE